ncbi:MAG: sulfotransferase, partial [Bacteroidetes bacterium]|nr:sulfotransferase [Bacteroidota bacterium]
MKDKIALMIIGAQKAGTTSLNNYLAQHPQIYTHFTLEFTLFNRDHYKNGFDYYFENSISDHRKNDPNCLFIAKSVGLLYKPELLQKLKEDNPNTQIIIVL